jgi:hypothetical protein
VGVTLVDESIQIAAAPPEDDREICVELARYPPELANWDRVEPSALDERYVVLTDAAPLGEILLAPSESMSKRSEADTEANVVHATIIGCGGLPPLT